MLFYINSMHPKFIGYLTEQELTGTNNEGYVFLNKEYIPKHYLMNYIIFYYLRAYHLKKYYLAPMPIHRTFYYYLLKFFQDKTKKK